MSDALLTTLISSLTAILVAWISIAKVRDSRRIKRIQSQVENNHVDEFGNPINLREEQDERHTEVIKVIRQLSYKVENVNGEVQHVNRKVDAVFSRVDKLNDKFEDLEDTVESNSKEIENGKQH